MKVLFNLNKYHKNIGLYLFILLTIILCILEILAYLKEGNYSYIASRIWVATGFLYIVSLTYFIIRTLISDIKKRFFIGWLAIIFIAIIVFGRIGSIENNKLSAEATQQVAAGQVALQDKDLKYTHSAFLGYPSRQYIIAALPSYFLGRNLLNLRLGFALPFFFGILIFYSGLRTYFDKHNLNPNFIALILISITSFPYLVEFLRMYDQVIFPTAFTLHAVGWFLLLINKTTILNAINLSFIGAVLATSYTPSLGSWALLLVMLLLLLYKKIIEKSFKKSLIYLCCFLIIGIFGLTSFYTRRDIELKPGAVSEDNSIIKRISQGYKTFVFSDKKVFVSQIMTLPVILYLTLSLFGRFGIRHFIISSWAIMTIGLSVYLKGYATPQPLLGLHRSIIIIPVITTAIFIILAEFIASTKLKIDNTALYITFVAIGAFSIFSFYNIIQTSKPNATSYLLKDLTNQSKVLGISSETPINIGILSSNNEFISIYDSLQYYFPKHHLTLNDQACLSNFDYSLHGIIYTDNTYCLGLLKNNPNLQISQFGYQLNDIDYVMFRITHIPK